MHKSEKDFEIQRKFMILKINKECRTEWTTRESKKGKVISVKWENRKVAYSLIPLYQDKGWIVSHEVMIDKTGRTFLINIKRPPNTSTI